MNPTPFQSVGPVEAGVGAAPERARRRYLTMLFADLCDSTRIAELLEAETYGALIGQLRETYLAVVQKHTGLVVRVQGDGVLAVFGYPDAHEHDCRRATDAAIELRARVRALRVGGDDGALDALVLQTHCGVHSGLVLVEEGDLVRGRLELMGSAPNIAARLSEAAGPGEVLVSEESLGPELHFFETTARRHLKLKGRADPLPAFGILGRTPVQNRFELRSRRVLAPFVGRGRELAQLRQARMRLLNGERSCWAIVGSPGIGKSRLFDELVQGAPSGGVQLLRGYCDTYANAGPLQPFLHVLRELLNQHDLRDAAEARAVPASAALARLASTDPALLAHRTTFARLLSSLDPDEPAADGAWPSLEATSAAWSALFHSLARLQPVLLLIDDWQWADDASRAVLRHLLADASLLLLVVLSARQLDPADARLCAQGGVLPLGPLAETEAEQNIRHLLPSATPFRLAEIRSHAGGNPLFIEELCHYAATEDPDPRASRPQGGAAWLDILIESRVSRLPQASIELVRVAAVIGPTVPTWLFTALTDLAPDHPLVRGLAEQDLLFPGDLPGVLRFKHAIVRDVIYESVGLHQRKSLHLRIADAHRLHGAVDGQDEALETLAYHYGGAGKWHEAIQYAELAAARATAASALDHAKRLYRSALAALDRLPASAEIGRHWLETAQRFGLACVFDAARDDLPVFQQAVERARALADPREQARALYWLAYIHYALGDSREAIFHGRTSLLLAHQVGDDKLVVQVQSTLGQAQAAVANYDAAEPLLDSAIQVKRRHRSGTRLAVGLAYSLACKASVLGDRGQFDSAQAAFDEALAMLNGAHHEVGASILGWRAAVYLWQGRWESARDTAQEAGRIGEQVHSLFTLAMSSAARGYALWLIERSDAAAHDIAAATAWLEPRRGGLYVSLNHGWLADTLQQRGHRGAARLHAARALRRARVDDLLGTAMAWRALARQAAGEGQAARAAHALRQADAIAERRQSAHERVVNALCAAEIALNAGDLGLTREQLDRCLEGGERLQMHWHLATAAQLYRQL